MTTMMSETMYSLCIMHLSGNIICWRTSTKLNSFNAVHLNIYTKHSLFVIALNIMYIFTKWFFINCLNYKFCHKSLRLSPKLLTTTYPLPTDSIISNSSEFVRTGWQLLTQLYTTRTKVMESTYMQVN